MAQAQGRLEKFYEDTFGTPQSRGELYTGFFLIIAGFVLSVVGTLIFVGIAQQFGENDASRWDWRETGGIVASLGPAAILVGISVTLPSKWTMRILDAVGVLLCLIGTGAFMYLYPERWNVGTGEEVWGVLAYVAGLAALLASTITSLIGYYVSRFSFAAGGAGGPDVTASEYNYDIPDSVIEKDIELAMRRYNVSWGGEGADAQGKSSVQFQVRDEFAAGTIIGGKGVARSVTLDAPQVDTATDKLRGLRAGRGTGTVDNKSVDDTTAALLKFRQQKVAQAAAKEAARRRGFWAWVKSLFSRKKPAAAAVAAAPKPQSK